MGAKLAHKTKNNFTIKYLTRAQRYYRNFAAGLGAFLLAYVCASILAPVQASDATELINITNTNTGYYVNVSTSTAASGLNLSVNSTALGTLASATDTLTTTTNSPTGYKLYISASPNYLYLDGDSTNSDYFAPLGSSLAIPTKLNKNTWGYALNKGSAGVVDNSFSDSGLYNVDGTNVPSSEALWATVPTEAEMIQNVDSSNEATGGTNLDVYYGVNASTALSTGNYQGVITYTAIAEGVTTDYDTMQNFTATMCDALETSTASADHRIALMDERDRKTYKVAKLADGHCWMVQNLALDGGITLTPEDSNVTTNRPLNANISDGTPSVNDAIQIYSGIANNSTTECNSQFPYCIVSNETYGNLYNFMAATAGVGGANVTGTISEDICPTGWHLPDNGTISGLITYANLTKASSLGDGSNVRNDAYVKAVQQAPLYFSLAGHYGNVSVNWGRYARYWSRVVSSDVTKAYILSIDAQEGYLSPQGEDGKLYGFSVRCVFDPPTLSTH